MIPYIPLPIYKLIQARDKLQHELLHQLSQPPARLAADRQIQRLQLIIISSELIDISEHISPITPSNRRILTLSKTLQPTPPTQ